MWFEEFSVARRARALFCLALLVGFQTLAQAADATPTSLNLRVMAANLNGDTQKIQPFAIRIFQGLKPDVVAIQEFNYANNTTADFRALVDAAFGSEFVYYRETGSYSIPNGIISRYPIVASGTWAGPKVSDRGFAWAQVRLPGTNDLYVVSVHLYGSGSSGDRNVEATAIKNQIAANFPADAWVVVAGDMNTSSRTEPAIGTFKTFLSDSPIPADSEGNPNTNEPRKKPYDYVLPSFSLAVNLTNSVFGSYSCSNGLVFDSRVVPAADLANFYPVQSGDSGQAQHMAVVKDFHIAVANGGGPGQPYIVAQPQSQTHGPGSNVTFSVQAGGSPSLAYQWSFQGAPIAQATASAYTRTNAQLEDAGVYTVVITNSFGQVISSDAVLVVGVRPAFTREPSGQVVEPGAAVTFSAAASGYPAPEYQWQLDGRSLPGATGTSYTISSVGEADTGTYRVLASNLVEVVSSAGARLALSDVLAQWDFNSTTPDGNTTTGSTAPCQGQGVALLVGGVTASFATGAATDPAPDNSGWNTTGYPPATAGNKTAGAQFAVSTAGRQNIQIYWNQRVSNTGSKYSRLQYSTNGTIFYDLGPAMAVGAAGNFEPRNSNLTGVANVDDNPNFAFRIVSEFERTATGTGDSAYVGASGGYGSGGTVRFDLVTVTGALLEPPPAAPGFLGGAKAGPAQFQFQVSGTSGRDYVVEATANLGGAWAPLLTNAAPFTVIDTNLGPRKFYRAVPVR